MNRIVRFEVFSSFIALVPRVSVGKGSVLVLGKDVALVLLALIPVIPAVLGEMRKIK